MSKETTPLEALQNLTEYLTGDYRDCFEELSVIGTALEDYESLKILNENQKHNIEMLMEENKMFKQYFKALKIIKDIYNLEVYKNKLGQCFIEGTNILFPISKDKYELLKEILL